MNDERVRSILQDEQLSWLEPDSHSRRRPAPSMITNEADQFLAPTCPIEIKSEPNRKSGARVKFHPNQHRHHSTQRSFAIKSRRTNRLFRLDRLGSELVENLSEFFQSRNVIHRNELTSYEKITNHDEDEDRTSSKRHHKSTTTRQRRQQPSLSRQTKQQLDNHSIQNSNNCVCPFEFAVHQSSAPSGRFGEPNFKVAKLTHCDSLNTDSRKPTVRKLIGELISGGRNGTKRSKLALRLLRTPIFLAALFSSMLLISLLILYTLSFHQHNQFEAKTKLLFQEILTSSSSSSSSVIDLQDANQQQSANSTTGRGLLRHHINSRQLTTNQAVEQSSLMIESDTTTPSRVQQQLYNSGVVGTECAHYEGVVGQDGRSIVFKGIPYASPPVGSRRWSRPRPIWLDAELCPARNNQQQPSKQSDGQSSSTVVKQANEFKPHCVQMSPIDRRVSGSEDCLYLDIFSPANVQRNGRSDLLPVMVYIHGGFLAYGSSGQGEQVNWMPARPTGQLAAELEVILVAPNYRLQALGFMALSQLAQSNLLDGSEGNYGLWDQLAALKWIKRNIESFGGNPNNIILFGPDSASALPLALLSRRPATADLPTLTRPRLESGAHQGQDNTFGPASISSERRGGNTTTANQTKAALPANRRDDESSEDGELFHAVWLINPAVYYEQPYELANQHYQRLIESQSVCSSSSSSNSSLHDQQANPISGRRESAVAASASSASSQQFHSMKPPRSDRMLTCLMNLSAEQVVREYLGRDDPAFRLDDQSSLPIRNIFADQFVTIDEQLVQNSYPFGNNRLELLDSSPSSSSEPSEASRQQPQSAVKSEKRLLIGSSAQAVEYWPCPRNLYNWNWDDFRRYVGTSLNSFNPETYKQASEVYLVPTETGGSGGKGSALPATNDDPIGTYLTMVSDIRQICPINELSEELRRRRGDGQPNNNVERYIVEWRPSEQLSASLRQPANNCGLETTPSSSVESAKSSNNDNNRNDHNDSNEQPVNSHQQKRGEEKTSRRETNITLAGGEQQPNEKETTVKVKKRNVGGGGTPSTKSTPPRYAFHYWDLLAFFGFDSMNNLPLTGNKEAEEGASNGAPEPSEQDLIFQSEIRKMVKQFVWFNSRERRFNPSSEQEEQNNEIKEEIPRSHLDGRQRSQKQQQQQAGEMNQKGQQRKQQQQSVKLFALDRTVKFLDKQMEYKESECKMWLKFLKHSYAWIS